MTITSHIDIFAEILNSSFFTMKQSEIKKKYPYVERDISWMYTGSGWTAAILPISQRKPVGCWTKQASRML